MTDNNALAQELELSARIEEICNRWDDTDNLDSTSAKSYAFQLACLVVNNRETILAALRTPAPAPVGGDVVTELTQPDKPPIAIELRNKARSHRAGGLHWIADDLEQAAKEIENCKHSSQAFIQLAADERDRAILLSSLLQRAREYVTDALEAQRHTDGEDLLRDIDAALQSPPAPEQDAVERVAKAIHEARMVHVEHEERWDWDQAHKPYYHDLARAALAAMPPKVEAPAADEVADQIMDLIDERVCVVWYPVESRDDFKRLVLERLSHPTADAVAVERERWVSILEDARGNLEFARNSVTHPNGRRAHHIDSTDQILVDAMNEGIEQIAAAIRSGGAS